MSRRQFNLLRACFWLLAVAVGVALVIILALEAGCIWLIAVIRVLPVGGCIETGNAVRDVWSEMLTAILALLLAARSGNGPPPPDKDQE